MAPPPSNAVALCLLAFAVGVGALQWQAALPPAWIAPAALGALLALRGLVGRLPRVRRVVVVRAVLAALAAAAAGFGYAGWRAGLRLADELPPQWEGQDIVVVGVVDDLPQSSPQGTRFTLAVEHIVTLGAVVPRRLSLAWYGARGDRPGEPAPVLAPGERWQLGVRLKRPHGNANPHGFDVEAWLLENNLRGTGYVRPDAPNRRLDAFAGRLGDYVERSRAAVRERIHAALPAAPYAGVLVALAIGDQRAITEAQWLVFARTGVTHLVSISGLHVTAFAALAAVVASALARRSTALTTRVPARSIALLLGVAAAAGYVALAGAQVPAQRTLLMLGVAALGLWIARPASVALVWLWALVAVLAFDPWAVLAAGFWLSFGAVGLLLYAGHGRLVAPPPTRFPARVGGALRAAAGAQFVVTVGMVPATLALFQQVSLLSPLANAVAIPVITFAVVPLTLAGVAIPVEALWQAAHALLGLQMALLEAMAALPGAAWAQHAPPPWALPAALIGVGWLLAPPGIPARALGLAWLLPLFLVRPPPPMHGSFRMTVLDVGQGLAVAVETATRALLYDTGPRYSATADAGARIVAPYLRAAGVARLDMLVVSHQDVDHSGGAASLLRTVPVGQLSTSLSGEQRAGWPIDAAAHTRCETGQRWVWDGVAFSVLHPPPSAYVDAGTRSNDLSCVLRIDSAHGSALIPGDIEAVSEAALVAAVGRGLAADVLVVPHHGSRTSSTPAFVAAVEPRVAVFTPGYRNRFGHPRPEVVARYAAAARYRTDLDGALAIEFAPESSLRPTRARDTGRRYWHDPPLASDGAIE
jgi:competence protein ComEC